MLVGLMGSSRHGIRTSLHGLVTSPAACTLLYGRHAGHIQTLPSRRFCIRAQYTGCPLDVLHVDPHVVAINKPPGVLSQPDYSRRPILQDMLSATFPFTYIVHRLDLRVSGCVLLARTKKAAARISISMREGQAVKQYLALCEMTPTQEASLLPQAWHRLIGAEGADETLDYRVLAVEGGYVLLKVCPNRGKKHQIRRLLANAGLPIAGDFKYGAEQLPFIALHAASVRLSHPIASRPELKIIAPLSTHDKTVMWEQHFPANLVRDAARELSIDPGSTEARIWEPAPAFDEG